jgi:hypothetical protein
MYDPRVVEVFLQIIQKENGDKTEYR